MGWMPSNGRSAAKNWAQANWWSTRSTPTAPKKATNSALTRMIAEAVHIPVIASGGGGKPEHLYDVLTEGKADAALVASMLHYGEYTVREIKEYLAGRGIKSQNSQ